MAKQTQVAALSLCGQYGALVASYIRALKARRLSPNSIKTYHAILGHFGAYLLEQRMPTAPEHISREHVEHFLTSLSERGHKPAGISTRHAALKVFFRWLVDEGELVASPMVRVRSPQIPETPPPVLTDEQIAALLRACAGKTFADRRAMAIIRLLLDTGLRVSELAGIQTAQIDWDRAVVTVTGKGDRRRLVPFGSKTSAALDRYQRERGRHKLAALPDFWLGHHARLGTDGVRVLLRDRAALAGLEARIYPHLLRHCAAHRWLKLEGQETDAMKLFGWRSRKMLEKYGASAAVERAIEAHRRIAPGDKI